MPRPADVPAFVKALHASYESRTGYKVRWNTLRERQWWDWCEFSDWTWTEKELARVIGYLRAKISKGERNDGALLFRNMIEMPDRFEEDLNLALEAAKGTFTKPRKPTAPISSNASDLVNAHGEAAFTGTEARASFMAMLANTPPEAGKAGER